MSKNFPQGFRLKKEETVSLTVKLKQETMEELESFEALIEKEDPSLSINRNDVVDAGIREFLVEARKAFDKHLEKKKGKKGASVSPEAKA